MKKRNLALIITLLTLIAALFLLKLPIFRSPPTTVSINYLTLETEALSLVEQFKNSGKRFWDRNDVFPLEASRLKPLVIIVRELDSGHIVDIETSAGFRHAGYLVFVNVSDSSRAGYEPPYRVNCRKIRLAPHIFKYEE